MLRTRLTKFEWVIGVGGIAAILVLWLTDGALRWFWLSLVCTTTGLAVGLGVSFPRWQMFGRSLCQVETHERLIALTFDDGPDPVTTPELLALLAERGARATFFCVGKRVEQHPTIVRRLVAEGHRIENHSWDHSHWTNLFGQERLCRDLSRAQAAIQTVTGRAPIFLRPPMGLTNQRVFRAAAELGLLVAGYTARGRDRRDQAPARIAARLLKQLRPGAVFLLHDGGVPPERLLSALRLVFQTLEAEGYRCLPLDELTGMANGVSALIACGKITH